MSSEWNLSHQGAISGTGAPNYLGGARGIHYFPRYPDNVRMVAIASGTDHSMTTINVHDTANPTFAGKLSGADSPNYLGGAQGIDVYVPANMAWVASYTDNSLIAIYLGSATSPTPTLIGVIRETGKKKYLLGCTSVHMVIIGTTRYAFVTAYTDNALTIIDVSDASKPSHVASIYGAGSPNWLGGAVNVKIHTIGASTYAFVAAQSDDSLTIINITTPDSPTFVASIRGAGSPNYLDGAAGVFVKTIEGVHYAFVTSKIDNSLSIFNVSTPASPVLVSVRHGNGSPYYLGGAQSVFIQTFNTVEVACITSGTDDSLTIFDVTSPANPVHLTFLQGIGSPYHLDLCSDVYALVVDSNLYIYVASQNDNAETNFQLIPPTVEVAYSIAPGAMLIINKGR